MVTNGYQPRTSPENCNRLVDRRLLLVALVACNLVLTVSSVVFATQSSGDQSGPRVLAQPAGSCSIKADVYGSNAVFTGSISGLDTPSWTLYYGDGGSTSGSGFTLTAGHTYDQSGSFTAHLHAYSPFGFYNDCYTQVIITKGYTLDITETVNVSDTVTLVPPLRVNDSASVSDNVTAKLPSSSLVNETVVVGDQPTEQAPSGVDESAHIGDNVSIVHGSRYVAAPTGSIPLTYLIGAGAVGGAILLVVAWKLILPRIGQGGPGP